MKKIVPRIRSTVCSQDLREWVPSTVGNLLKELEHIAKANEKEDHLMLFRGQSNIDWPLDSTFVRDSITRLFNPTFTTS